MVEPSESIEQRECEPFIRADVSAMGGGAA